MFVCFFCLFVCLFVLLYFGNFTLIEQRNRQEFSFKQNILLSNVKEK